MAREPELEIKDGVLTKYLGPGGEVVIPEGVTALDRGAFDGCKALTRVTIPASLTRIGKYAFFGCSGMQAFDVSPDNPAYRGEGNAIFSRDGKTLVVCAGKTGAYEIPAGVTRLENWAFSGCRGLTSVTLPDGLAEICESAFSFCTGLTRLTIPGSVRRVGNMAFWFCEYVTEVTLEPGVAEIDTEAFRGCSRLEQISIPESVERIGDRAFCDCMALQRVAVPPRVKRIESWTFNGCRALADVSLPEGVSSIDDKAFYGCRSLTRVSLPPRVTALGDRAFAFCLRLKTIDLPAGLETIGPEAFFGCSRLTGVTIPERVTAIGSDAFCGCERLTEIAIPEGVKRVGRGAFAECTGLTRAKISDNPECLEAFRGCTALREYAVPPKSRRYSVVEGVVLSRDGARLIAYPPGRACARYDIPATVAKVCDFAFDGAPAKLVFVPESVKDFSRAAADGEDAPFVAYSRADFAAGIGRPVYLGPVADLSNKNKRRAVEGFLFALETGLPEIAPWKAGYVEYLREQRAVYEKTAWRNETLLKLMLEYRMLRPETAINMLKKHAAAGRDDLAAALRAYLDQAETSGGERG